MPVYDVKFRIRVSYQVGEFKARSPAMAAVKAEQLFIRTVKTGLECGGVPSPSSIGFDWLWGATVSRSAEQGRVIEKWVFSNDDGNWVPRDVPCRLRARRLKDFSPEEQDEIRRSIADGIPRKLAMIQVDTDRLREKQRTRRELIESAKVLLRRRHK